MTALYFSIIISDFLLKWFHIETLQSYSILKNIQLFRISSCKQFSQNSNFFNTLHIAERFSTLEEGVLITKASNKQGHIEFPQ